MIGHTLNHAEQTGIIDPYFVDTAVDFIRVYADCTHHGKEEDILFRDLRTKHLSEADRRMMDRLIQEHVFSRDTTRALIEANMHYRRNVGEAFGKVVAPLKALVNSLSGAYQERR